MSDIFVFPSKTETQGLVVIEAAASGLPLLTVKDDAYKNIVQNRVNGYQSKEDEKVEKTKVGEDVDDSKPKTDSILDKAVSDYNWDEDSD